MQPKELLDLVETFGNPLYVYDADKIEFQYNRLTNAFVKVEKLRINYAMKALSNISILKLLKNLGSGLDTVSIQEVQLGLHGFIFLVKITNLKIKHLTGFRNLSGVNMLILFFY